jgi:hypothetical protein
MMGDIDIRAREHMYTYSTVPILESVFPPTLFGLRLADGTISGPSPLLPIPRSESRISATLYGCAVAF